MKVRMNVYISGTRNGAYWPEIGGEIELSEQEALELIEGGRAVPVASVKDERAVAPAAEKRAPGRPRKS